MQEEQKSDDQNGAQDEVAQQNPRARASANN